MQRRNRTAGHLEFHIVRLYLDHKGVVLFHDDDNLPDQSTTRHDNIALFQILQHLRGLLLLPLHGEEEQEIENAEDRHHWQKADDGI